MTTTHQGYDVAKHSDPPLRRRARASPVTNSLWEMCHFVEILDINTQFICIPCNLTWCLWVPEGETVDPIICPKCGISTHNDTTKETDTK